jgi:ribosomal protein S18 acetylase RimI-like enzyme
MKKDNSDYQFEVLHSNSEELVKEILELEPFLPLNIQDTEEGIRENLNNRSYINIILKKDNRIIGYILSIPHNEAVRELKNDDMQMKEDDGRYYIDQIVVHPDFRKGMILLKLVYATFEEGVRRGFNKFSSHVLATDGLNKLMKRKFGKQLTEQRMVNLPIYNNAPFEYMEMTYHKKNQNKSS